LTQKLLPNRHVKYIFEHFAINNPTPETELKFNNKFQLLVAVILSAQATDISVNKATASLFKIIEEPADIIKLGEEKLITYIKSIGLYRAKAANIFKLCQILSNDYNSQVPNDYDQLIKLPGVGHKTAKVVLNCAFAVPIIAVDTHIYRVAQRMGIAYAKTALAMEKALLKAIPEEYHLHAHHWLILHGRYVCKARKPECKKCHFNKICLSAFKI
jgi:endonuclease-3